MSKLQNMAKSQFIVCCVLEVQPVGLQYSAFYPRQQPWFNVL